MKKLKSKSLERLASLAAVLGIVTCFVVMALIEDKKESKEK